jgi:hypothetical protein
MKSKIHENQQTKNNTMSKKAKLVFAIFTFIFITSCSKSSSDENNANNTNGGIISYTLLGQSYTSTNKVSVAIDNNKFYVCGDYAHNNLLGDQAPIPLQAGSYSNEQNAILTLPNGTKYSCINKIKITITSFNGSFVKGSFVGTVYLNGNNFDNPPVSVTGTFEGSDN